MWAETENLSYDLIKSQSQSIVEQIKIRLDLFIFERGKDLAHLGSLWQNYSYPTNAQRFFVDAEGILSREKSYQAINFFDSTGKFIVQNLPQNGGTPQPPINRIELLKYINTILKNKETLFITTPFVSSGEKELILFHPVYLKDSDSTKLIGIVSGTMLVKKIIDKVVNESNRGSNHIVITIADTVLFESSRNFKKKRHIERAKAVTDFYAAGRTFAIAAFPPENGTLSSLLTQNDLRLISNLLASLVASILLAIALQLNERSNLMRIDLEKSEQRYRRLAENASDMIFQQTIPDGKYEYVSPAAEKITGYLPEDFYSRPDMFWELVVKSDRSHYGREWEKIAKGTLMPSFEYRITNKSGMLRWIIQKNVIVFDSFGKPVAVEGIISDITEQKRAIQERERLIHELEEKNKDLERFTYIISHELKTPLITIKGFIGYLENEAVSGNLSQLHDDIIRIVSAADTMQQLLNNLIEFNKIGHIQKEPEIVDMNELLYSVVSDYSDQLKSRRIKLNMASNFPQVYGFKDEINELLQKLIENAIKFTRGQEEPLVEIGVKVTDDNSMFFIRDNGIGFDPRYSERIFGLFNKLNSEIEGTGAGLALVKKIIDHHGGWIRADSKGFGTGTEISFVLPLYKANH
jgi:PAS domain S-box-containing protein